MWQALFAAAVAASTGLLAKNHLFKPAATISDSDSDSDPPHDTVSDPATLPRSPALPWESDCEDQVREGIFRFSSDSGSGKKKSKTTRFRLKKTKKKRAEGSEGVAAEEQRKKKSGRRVGVCLKKRKTVASSSKCGSSSSNSKDNPSLFSWGLNIGIMYMMTAGKAEINKLNTTMDETAKVVQELKSELNKRKASQSQQVSRSESEANTQCQSPSCKCTQTEMKKSSALNSEPNYMRASSFQISDGECPSSVLTEEQEPDTEVMDMDQLEAELESELLKLPWCSTEAPQEDGFRNLGKDIISEASAQKYHGQAAQGIDIEQFQGVLPAELDQKLCHVLIEQQESQIVELESELQSAQSKLQEKETELQALKDCVKRLTQLSLSTVSDDENEAHNEQEQTTSWNCNMEISEYIKPVVGMKRPIDSD